jgi:heme/copper-type cytochrome/quinol oxidase subunit 4
LKENIVLSMSRPLGRLPFLLGISGLNVVILCAVLLALAFRPTGGGHLAVLIIVGGLQFVWMALHVRRFLDAGHGRVIPVAAFLLCFAIFAVGYLVLASLWASPEVQREAFRTAGGLSGSGAVNHLETIPLLIDSGRMIASALGAAGAVVLSGMILVGFGLTAFVSGCFSLIAAMLPGGRTANRPLPMTRRPGWISG